MYWVVLLLITVVEPGPWKSNTQAYSHLEISNLGFQFAIRPLQLPEEVTTYSTVSTCSSSDSCFFHKEPWPTPEFVSCQKELGLREEMFLLCVDLFVVSSLRPRQPKAASCILMSFCLLCLQVKKTSSSTFSSGFWLTPGSAQGLLPGSSIGSYLVGLRGL